jgi:hypothetical protein
MKSRVVAGVILLLAALGIAWPWMPHEARGQKKEGRQQWEYKVVASPQFGGRQRLLRDANAYLNKQLNDLAADGWEYVGPVVSLDEGVLRSVQIVFKRPKP